MYLINQILSAIDLKVVFFHSKHICFYQLPLLKFLKGSYRPFCKFANPYKSQKSNFKIFKIIIKTKTWAFIRFNVPNSLFYKIKSYF